MSELTKNTEVLARLSTFLPSSLGYTVFSTHNDEQSTKVALKHKDDSSLKLYVSVVQLDDKFYSITYTSKTGTSSLSSSFDFNFDGSAMDISLPTTAEKIDSVYNGFAGDWSSSTFVGYTLNRLHIVPKKILPEELNVIGQKYLVPVVQGNNVASDGDVKPLIDRLKSALSEVFIIPGAILIPRKNSLKRLSTDDDENTNAPTYKSTSRGSDASKALVDLPKFDDEYDVSKLLYPDSSLQPPIPSVGGDDIYGPAGKFPDTRPGLTGPLGEFNGMIVDKNHPLFGQGGAGAGIGRFNPPGVGGAPPGARGDDPFGPIDDNVGMGLPYGSSRGGAGRGGFGSMGGPFGGGAPGFNSFM